MHLHLCHDLNGILDMSILLHLNLLFLHSYIRNNDRSDCSHRTYPLSLQPFLFMEDYTYHLAEGQKYSLGAHMLEVCPSVAAERPRIEVHPLGIGDRQPPPHGWSLKGKQGVQSLPH